MTNTASITVIESRGMMYFLCMFNYYQVFGIYIFRAWLSKSREELSAKLLVEKIQLLIEKIQAKSDLNEAKTKYTDAERKATEAEATHTAALTAIKAMKDQELAQQRVEQSITVNLEYFDIISLVKY